MTEDRRKIISQKVYEILSRTADTKERVVELTNYIEGLLNQAQGSNIQSSKK
jgi:hypothetical protein